MALQRRGLANSRRRLADEGEDDEGIIDPADDSQSEPSDEAMDADASSNEAESTIIDQPGVVADTVDGASGSTRGKGKKRKPGKSANSAAGESTTTFIQSAETSAMMNGLRGNGDPVEQEAVDFDDLGKDSNVVEQGTIRKSQTLPLGDQSFTTQPESQQEQPSANAPVTSRPVPPSRGTYFMHDDRNISGGGGAGRGRGRGRGFVGAQPPFRYGLSPHLSSTRSLIYASRRAAAFPEAEKARWTHDLHDTITNARQLPDHIPAEQHRPEHTEKLTSPLSKTTSVASVTVRVLLPNMSVPIFSGKMTLRHHTRLPDLRPPLRRDKPVRISLPGRSSSVQWPNVERSFIFIPRTQRPGYQKTQSRGLGPRSQPDSRRTSIYGGSVYTPSIAMSRRSSQARDGYGTPSGNAMLPQSIAPHLRTARPIVKLPSAQDQFSTINPAFGHSYDGTNFGVYSSHLPTQPTPAQAPYQESVPANIPMHQPRPQKAVTVASIESPRRGGLSAADQQEDQLFHHQVPAHVKHPSTLPTPQNFVHSRQLSMHGGQDGNSPLTNIPEGAINAQAFQPLMMPQQPYYPPGYGMQPVYYYGPPQVPPEGQQNAYNANSMASPVYMQQGPYFVPMYMPQAMPVADGGPWRTKRANSV